MSGTVVKKENYIYSVIAFKNKNKTNWEKPQEPHKNKISVNIRKAFLNDIITTKKKVGKEETASAGDKWPKYDKNNPVKD